MTFSEMTQEEFESYVKDAKKSNSKKKKLDTPEELRRMLVVTLNVTEFKRGDIVKQKPEFVYAGPTGNVIVVDPNPKVDTPQITRLWVTWRPMLVGYFDEDGDFVLTGAPSERFELVEAAKD